MSTGAPPPVKVERVGPGSVVVGDGADADDASLCLGGAVDGAGHRGGEHAPHDEGPAGDAVVVRVGVRDPAEVAGVDAPAHLRSVPARLTGALHDADLLAGGEARAPDRHDIAVVQAGARLHGHRQLDRVLPVAGTERTQHARLGEGAVEVEPRAAVVVALPEEADRADQDHDDRRHGEERGPTGSGARGHGARVVRLDPLEHVLAQAVGRGSRALVQLGEGVRVAMRHRFGSWLRSRSARVSRAWWRWAFAVPSAQPSASAMSATVQSSR